MGVAGAKIERILVRGTNWIGDAVMSTPALGRLRSSFPTAEIMLLASPRTAGLFEAAPYLDRLLVYRRREEGWPAFLRMARALRRERADLAILFQNAFEAGLLARLGGVPLRVGYSAQGRGALLTHAVAQGPHRRDRFQAYDYLDLVATAERACFGREVAPPAGRPVPSLLAGADQTRAARARLASSGLGAGGRPLIALNAGATNSRAKCWPEERFAALADRLVAELGAEVVLIGAAAERESAARVIAGMRAPGAVNLAGETSVSELVGLLAGCDLLVSNDTGPAHIAAALGRPTLTLFGPTNEFETAPTGPRATILRADGIECARCMLRDCPIDHRCMTRLGADAVAARAISLAQSAALPAPL